MNQSSTRPVRSSAGVFAVAALLTGIPSALFALKYHFQAALSSMPGDVFYYLTITQRSRGFHGFTFDGRFPTNGFHPLWQWILSLCAHTPLLPIDHPVSAAVHVFWISIFINAMAAGAFVALGHRLLDRSKLALLSVCPGFLWVISAQIAPQFLSTWSYANGMESSLSLLLVSLACLVYLRGDSSVSIVFAGTLLGLGVLGRLDEIFVVLAFAFYDRQFQHKTAGNRVFFVLPPVLMLATYMTYNYLAVGSPLPLSGRIKAGLGFMVGTREVLRFMLPVFSGDAPFHGRSGVRLEIGIRLIQMILPALICAFELWRKRRANDRSQLVYRALCLGVVLKATYNYIFVSISNQGVWYYALSVAVANLVVCTWIHDGIKRDTVVHRYPRLTWFAYGCLVVLAFSNYLAETKAPDHTAEYEAFVDGASLAHDIRQVTQSPLIDLSDGQLSYATGLPTVSGFGFALDVEAVNALKHGTFFALMRSRGITAVAASMSYEFATEDYINTQAWHKGWPLFFIQPSEFEHFQLVPIFRDPRRTVIVWRVQPR